MGLNGSNPTIVVVVVVSRVQPWGLDAVLYKLHEARCGR